MGDDHWWTADQKKCCFRTSTFLAHTCALKLNSFQGWRWYDPHLMGGLWRQLGGSETSCGKRVDQIQDNNDGQRKRDVLQFKCDVMAVFLTATMNDYEYDTDYDDYDVVPGATPKNVTTTETPGCISPLPRWLYIHLQRNKKTSFLSKEATSPCQGHLNCVTFLINFGVNIWDLDIDLHSAKVLGLGKEMKELKYDYRNNMIIEGMLNILTRSSSWLSSSSSSPGSRCDQQPRRHLEVPGRSRRSARGGQFKTSKIFAGEGKISKKTYTFFVYRRRLKKKQRNE